MRELALFAEYLRREQLRHQQMAQRIASGSMGAHDYQAIVQEAKAAELIGRLSEDLKALEDDTAEFVKKYLQQ